MRRLLNHTAGISMPSASGTDRDAALPSLIDELTGQGATKTRVEIVRTPGDGFDYSAGGYAILQLLVEDVTGLQFADYTKRSVFTPLGMTSTTFGWTVETARRAATPYLGDGSAYRLCEFSAAGAAGLTSTIQDMSTFLLAHCPRTSGTNGVLKPTTIERMRTEGVAAAAPGRGASYGFGYALFAGPRTEYELAGHSGSNQGWKAELMFMPAEGLGIVVLTNAGDGKARNDVMRLFRDEARARVLRRGTR